MKEAVRKLWANKTARILLIAGAALILLLVSWLVFGKGGNSVEGGRCRKCFGADHGRGRRGGRSRRHVRRTGRDPCPAAPDADRCARVGDRRKQGTCLPFGYLKINI